MEKMEIPINLLFPCARVLTPRRRSVWALIGTANETAVQVFNVKLWNRIIFPQRIDMKKKTCVCPSRAQKGYTRGVALRSNS
jgi:hypothetical protein